METKKEDDEKKEVLKTGYFQLFRFATVADKILIFIAVLAAVGVGLSQPALFIVLGDMTDSLIAGGKFALCETRSEYYNYGICQLAMKTMSTEELALMSEPDFLDVKIKEAMDEVLKFTYAFIGIGMATWLCGWVQATVLMITCNKQTTKLRVAYFGAILRQDVGYFDTHSAAELNTRLLEDVKKISNGIGDKIGVTVQALMQCLGGIVVGFIYGWKMCLVILALSPVIVLTGYLFFVITTKFSKSELDSYAKSGDMAEEVLSSIRTVAAFGGQKEELDRFEENLEGSKIAGIKKHLGMGFAFGFTYLCVYSIYGLAFWYGGTLVADTTEDTTIGHVMTTFFAVVIGSFGLSQAGQTAEYFASAQAAAYAIYEVLDRVPEIDIHSEAGVKLEGWHGNVKFDNVDFSYPARLDQQVLKSVSFDAAAGQTIALCGQSGCGKSTCIQLLQRFYDATSGTVSIGEKDIKDINIRWLREQVGIVSQEPILFDMSVKENILMGYLDATDAEIDQALKKAHAYDFVQKLPSKADTNVGQGGGTLSGGQKQRIAIARSLIRNPTLLLLDEATSALDTESESIVQRALESASEGRTTIVIAHRLSTIKNADKIIGFASGTVVEEGTHDSLMAKTNGVYANLCNMQTFGTEGEDNEVEIRTRKKSEKEKFDEDDKETGEGQEEKDMTDQKEEEIPEQSLASIYKLNQPEILYNIAGSIIALIVGAVQPVFAIVFAEILALFSKYACVYDLAMLQVVNDAANNPTATIDPAWVTEYEEAKICQEPELMKEVTFWALMFVVIGVANFFGYIMFEYLFGYSGEQLTLRLRTQSYKKYLELEMGYFDEPLNSTGTLAARLASDASRVQGAIGSRLAIVFQNIGALGAGFIIAFIYEWRLTLVCLGFIPFLAGSMMIMMSVFTGEAADKERVAFEEAGKCTGEATTNIRTVASLGREAKFVNHYEKQLQPPLEQAIKKSWLFGFMYGMSNGLQFLMFAGCFYFASWLMQEKILAPENFSDIFKVLFALLMGAMTAGQAGAMVPNFADAKISANKIIQLLNQKSSIDPFNEGGRKLETVAGRLTFSSVQFHYPTRPGVPVLRGLTLNVEPGQTVAFVGQSGCGKSTCIQLIERFYDGTSGDIALDGVPVNQLNLQWLRRQIGFVQQEPVLFNTTIEKNIVYGNKYYPAYSQEEIDLACKQANAFNFIQDLPSKYETGCGKRGNQLSGGQKQRVAIARALIRNPKILLLDEATSALDTESEKIVQDALNKASMGRTCILIAHRLSTVINADIIAVIDNGVIVEAGPHTELIAKKGAYYSLVNSQL